uniref:Uncharacterized protein n=1 Tax=Cacopsylla melanoneura TaxID=428564 RepID=A0A8D8T744_9HEMI
MEKKEIKSWGRRKIICTNSRSNNFITNNYYSRREINFSIKGGKIIKYHYNIGNFALLDQISIKVPTRKRRQNNYLLNHIAEPRCHFGRKKSNIWTEQEDFRK